MPSSTRSTTPAGPRTVLPRKVIARNPQCHMSTNTRSNTPADSRPVLPKRVIARNPEGPTPTNPMEELAEKLAQRNKL